MVNKFYIYGMPMQTLITKKRSGVLDLLRFFAVLYVFFGHYTDTFNLTYQIVPANLKYIPFSRFAGTAITLFFMISGYVVTMTSIQRNLKEFTIARLSRIYPLFWVSCIAAYLLPRIIHNHTYLGVYSLKNLLANLTMFPEAFGYPMINPVFHTLPPEMVFYLIIALIIGFRLWKRIIWINIILVTFCIINIFCFSLPIYLGIVPFTSGMLFYLLKAKWAEPWKIITLLFLNFACASYGAIYLTTLPTASILEQTHIWVRPGITFLYYILFVLLATDKLSIKGTYFSQLLGEIAYPFYLFHIYFFCFYYYFRNSIQSDLLLYGILISTFITSCIINKWVEKPISNIANTILYYIINFKLPKTILLQNKPND